MRVTVEDGRLAAIEPALANEATPEGPCLKGLSYVETAAQSRPHPSPAQRRPDGSFGRITWDERPRRNRRPV